MPLVPGTLLNNRYRIVSILGQGGMGAVYRAHDEHLNIPVAVKENLFLTQEYGRQFQSEARILAGLRHSNLPHVTDYFALENHIQYLVMDYVEGEDLRQRMERMGTLPERETTLIGISICDALSYLHSRRPPIVHRDIKPGNIKVTPDGQAVLVDFGLAKVMQGEQVTSTGARAMTPGYSPPEQYGTARTDGRSDIYSLGATLYAAITGIIPEDALHRATGKVKLTPLRDLAPKISRKLADSIERALDIDPERRFQTVEEFKKALVESGELASFYQERPSIPPPPAPNPGEDSAVSGQAAEGKSSAPKSREEIVRQHRKAKQRAFWMVLPIVTLSIAAAIYGISLLKPSLAAPIVAYFVTPSATLEQTTDVAAAATTQTPGLSVEKTPSKEIETAQPVQTQLTAPTQKPDTHLNATSTLSSTATAVPSATPRGGGTGQIAFASNRGGNFQIWLMSADGKQGPRQITNAAGGACQPTWSPDGTKIAFTSPCPGSEKHDSYVGANIWMIELGMPDKATRLTSGIEGDYDPAWSPDGKRIAYTSLENGRSGIYVLTLDDLTWVKLSGTRFEDKQPAWSTSGLMIAFVRQMLTSQIRKMSDSGQFDEQFSVSGPVNDLWPAWTNDDQAIYYSQMSPDSPVPYLVIQRYEDRKNSREVRIPGDPKVNSGPFANVRQSPDGQWFVYESWSEENHDIYLMNANGSNPTRLTTDRAYDFGPAWRPVANNQLP